MLVTNDIEYMPRPELLSSALLLACPSPSHPAPTSIASPLPHAPPRITCHLDCVLLSIELCVGAIPAPDRSANAVSSARRTPSLLRYVRPELCVPLEVCVLPFATA